MRNNSLRKTFRWTSGCASLAGILLAAGTAGAITFSGRVVDSTTGAGVAGLVNYSWIGAPGFVTTDGNGNWSSSGWVNVESSHV